MSGTMPYFVILWQLAMVVVILVIKNTGRALELLYMLIIT
jgi:hypothetical protein